MSDKESDTQTEEEKPNGVQKWAKRIFYFLAVTLPLAARDALINFVSSSPNILYFIAGCICLVMFFETHKIVGRVKRGEPWIGAVDQAKTSNADHIKRARVLIVEKKLVIPSDEDEPLRMVFGFMNLGDADAVVTIRDSTYYVSTDPKQTVFKYQPSPPFKIPVEAVPNAIWHAELRYNIKFTPEKLKALKKGDARLLFYARVNYQDSTGEEHPLPFAEMYDYAMQGNLIAPPDDTQFE